MAIDTRGGFKILAAFTMLLCAGWTAAGLVFRFTAYGSMPVAPGEPYGEADVLELIHYGVLVIFSGLAVLQGFVLLVLGRFRLRRLAAFMCLFGLALPFAYRPLHSRVASLAIVSAFGQSQPARCVRSLPIESEAMAICWMRHRGGPQAALSEQGTAYSAVRIGPVWRVSIAPPKTVDIGGGYMVDIEARSGEIVKPEQRR